MSKEFLEEFYEVVKPVQQWVKDKNFNPHQYIAIDLADADIGERTHSIVFEVEDE